MRIMFAQHSLGMPLAAAGVLIWSGCQAIVGISERELGSNASGVSSECKGFCEHVETECSKLNFPAYIKRAACEAVCKNFDPPDAGSLTLACLEENAGALSEPEACESAGPSGGGKCGDRCAVYCRLYQRICERYPAGSSSSECESRCGALSEGSGVAAVAAFDGSDTLQCRFAHLGAAAEESVAGNEKNKQMHCRHALVNPYVEPKCLDKPPQCERYCSIVMRACVGDNQQYQTLEQCQAVCAGFPLMSEASDAAATSLVCRLKNAYGAFEQPGTQLCMQAGPAGGGDADDGCGSSCHGYCEQLSRACATQGFERYGTVRPIEACTEECNSMGHAMRMRRFKCRLDSIANALVSAPNDKTLCDNAFGNGMCAPGTGQ